jgi:hypothetical protein
MRVNTTERRQASIPSNGEEEAKPVVVVVSRGGEARRQKGRLGGVQTKENEEEMLDIQEKEMSGNPKSERPIEMEAVAIERIERTVEGFHRNHKTGRNWIWTR